jgi:hypothetical protein
MAYVFFGSENHPFGRMLIYIPVLVGYYYAVVILTQRFSDRALNIVAAGGVLLALLHALFAWNAEFDVFCAVTMSVFAVFSYLFFCLVKRPASRV